MVVVVVVKVMGVVDVDVKNVGMNLESFPGGALIRPSSK
jgi:hypothetical protein